LLKKFEEGWHIRTYTTRRNPRVSKELVLHYVRDHNVQTSFRQSAPGCFAYIKVPSSFLRQPHLPALHVLLVNSLTLESPLHPQPTPTSFSRQRKYQESFIDFLLSIAFCDNKIRGNGFRYSTRRAQTRSCI
jgi:hypothetical protein